MKKYPVFILLLLFSLTVQAQLHTDIQPQTSTTRRPFSKNILHGFLGRDSLPLARVWAVSLVVPGYSQLYNRQYWKLPVLYGSVGGLLYGGYHSNMKYMDTGDSQYLWNRRLFYLGAGLVYWAGLMDGLISYESSKTFLPQRATVFSLMLPGLGQAYNRQYWKIPIVYMGFAFGYYMINYNATQYDRFRTAYNIVTDNNPATVDEFKGRMTADNLKYYRDAYRRDRDYAVLLTIVFYVLNAVDANVFAHLKNFDVSDNLSMDIHPTIMYDEVFASSGIQAPAIGMKLRLTF
ncbi:MAG: DUF5683 domain-containing protein [Prevotellaceae bacterium]|nr:DUF5683 domain-containing protein [Prevotellaceae bacterium]